MPKKEIYARMAVQLRTHTRAIKAEKKCPGAMGLYLFLNLDARGEETNGDVDEDVAMSSWGAPGTYRRKQAEALIETGLIELRGDRLVVLRYEDHNDTPAQIAEARRAAAERKSRQRQSRTGHTEVPRDTAVTGGSGHGDVSGDARADYAKAPNPGSPPSWWAGAVDAAAMVVGDVSDPAARWAEYFASRDRKGWSANHTDAVGWLTSVVRRERREQADRGAPSPGPGASSTQPRPARRDLSTYQP